MNRRLRKVKVKGGVTFPLLFKGRDGDGLRKEKVERNIQHTVK